MGRPWLERPSYNWRFAGRDFVPAYPQLWDGLIGAWCPSLGCTGSRLLDWSPRQPNHGTLTNFTLSTAWANPAINGLVSDGTDDVVSGSFPAIAVPLTLEAWFISQSSSTIQTVLSLGSNSASNPFFIIRARGDLSQILEAVHDGDSGLVTGIAQSSATYTVGRLHHLVGTFAASSQKVYLDGVPSGTDNKTPGTTTINQWSMCALKRTTTIHFLTGSVLSANVYQRELSPGEIMARFALGPAAIYTPREDSILQAQSAAFNRRRRVLLGAA